MADTTQTFIDNLITVIWNAEDPESVTNEMVARVFDYLNKGYKDLLTNNSAVATEKSERQAADAALQRTIDTVQLALSTVQKTAESAQTAAATNRQSINLILGKNASQAIENFNEILAFLEGVKDSDSLVNLLDEIRQRLDGFDGEVERLDSIDEGHEDRITLLEELYKAIKVSDTLDMDATTETGIYYFSPSGVTIGNPKNILIVKSTPGLRIMGGGTALNVAQYLFDSDGLQYRTGGKSGKPGDVLTWGEWQGVGQKGAGNLINVTELVPLANGFYDLASAIEAVPAVLRALGRWITYRISTSEWETKKFTGSTLSQWETPGAWEDAGGKGKITGIKLNNQEVAPDAEGVVNITIDEVEVDETLSETSTNPVQNNVISQKIAELEAKTVADLDITLNDDETEAHIAILNSKRAEIAGGDIPVGKGGGSGEQGQSAKIVLSASVDNPVIREGSPVKLSITYDHQYLGGDQGGESTGQRADIEITVKNGAVTTFSTTLTDVAPGTLEPLDVTSYIRSGTTDITVKASVIDPETGTKRTRQATAQVRAMTLALSSSYTLANTIAGGGYGPYDTVAIPFTVSGSGSKTVSLYLDGQPFDTKVINKSGKTNGSFTVPMAGLTTGRHNVQMVAELEASETLTLYSESVFIDLLKANAAGVAPAPFIGAMIIFPDGRIFEGTDYLTPTLEVGQFERLDFDFVVYDPDTTPAEMAVYHDGLISQSITAPRTVQKYTNRFTASGTEAMMFKTGETEYHFNIEVVESSINLVETTDSLRVKLSASGRSNNEGNPGVWEFEDVTTDFNGFDWSTNGWTGDALRLTNGASIVINDTPFAKDATATGFTIEAELMCSNVSDREGVVMECMAEGVGFQMTTEQAKIRVSGGQELETKFAPDIPLKIAFVVQSKSDNRLLQLYVNGIRDRALQYQAAASLMQMNPAKISVSSDAADVELRNIRIYDRALTDDEILSNYMVDRQTVDEMVLLFEKNDILNDETDEVDIDKLRAQGKSVMRIVGDVDLVNQTNNKKFEVPVDVYFYSQYGKEYDFVARNIGLRIQGTSSTTYPRKNYRLYFDRIDKYECTLEVNGVAVPDMCYSFKPGARPVSIFCLKADFSDSSSTHNTGAVRIVNEVFKRCGWLTPPQAAYKGDYDVRVGVDGFPINLFYDNDGSGVSKFLGKYNFNNEKADSGIVYGFEGIEGYNDAEALNGARNKCICLEFLNNSAALCLFGTADMTNFDNELEFRFKADTKWADADPDDQAAVRRLWSWIQSCKGNPAKFLREYKNYFGNEAPFAWYVLTNYFMAVDNRAKNMMFVTWDGVIWYIIPYDMDTLFGERNDSYLKFDYMIDFDTVDESQGGAYCFAGHDSVLWELVRGCPDKLAEVARTIRANMSTEYVLDVLNNQFMGAWCERIYNKDGEYKYITPLLEDGRDYLYALQGSRYAHRTYTIVNRFNLLDSEYCAGTYRDDAFPVYFSYNFAANPRTLKITAAERFCFGYGMTNGDPTVSGLRANGQGDEITLTFSQNLIVNDPQNIYGASRIQGLDLTNVSHAIVGTLNLNKCLRLRSLDASCSEGQTTLTNMILENCRNLRTLDVNGLNGLSSLNLANNKKLETFDGETSKLTNVIFAQGGKLSAAKLPATIQTLELRYLQDLAPDALTFAATPAVTRLVVDNCPLIDWEALLTRCPSTTYLRVTGINTSGRGELLRKFLTMKGVDENGNNVNTCRLVGTYQLTKYLPESEYTELTAHFPELNIRQPEWTVIKYDETVSDGKNISNLDNETGYDYDNEFMPSAHVSAILAKRHKVMAKYTAEGEMTVCPLDDSDSRRYHDGTEANLQGFNHATKADEGDVMMFEPNRWCKGVDDFINRCHYDCFSSAKTVSQPEGRKLHPEDMELRDRSACRVSSAYATLEACLTVYDDYRVYIAPVAGYKQARWPAVNSSVYGAVFLDAEDKVVGRAAANSGRMTEESYLFASVPEGAVKIAFTCRRDVAFSFAWLTTSDQIEAIEPDAWQTGEYLVGVNKAYYGNLQIRSINGVSPTVSVSQSQFADYCRRRGKGFTLITYNMHRDIARLFWAKYGNRDSSAVCGYGSGSNTTLTGMTAFLGMKDTIANPSAAIGTAGGYYYDDTNTLRNATSINALGYDNLWGNVAEWMEGVHSEYLVYHIADPDSDTERKVKSGNVNDSWIVELHNGRFMDVVPVVLNGTETTHYRDKFWCSNSSARVVLRSGNNAYSNAGVSYALAVDDAASTNAWSGSRLAFIGKIVYTLNVAAFLEAEAIA